MEEYRKIHVVNLISTKNCMEDALVFIVERSLLRGGLDDKECGEIAELASHIGVLHRVIKYDGYYEESAEETEDEPEEDGSNGQDEEEQTPYDPRGNVSPYPTEDEAEKQPEPQEAGIRWTPDGVKEYGTAEYTNGTVDYPDGGGSDGH